MEAIQQFAEADSALLDLGRAVLATGYRFITPTPATHEHVVCRPGMELARSLRDVFGWSLPFRREILPPEIFTLMARSNILEENNHSWRSKFRLSSLGDSLFFHSAYPTAAHDAVFFGPDTYRFAAAVTRHLHQSAPIGRAIDVCSGAGVGGVVIAKARPDADITLADINPAALRLSRVNAALAEAPCVTTIESNLLAAASGVFDLIVANPPYLVDGRKRAYRHGGGAFGSGLSVSLLQASLPRLAPGGTLLLYTGSAIVDGNDPLRDEATNQLAAAPVAWSYAELDPDIFGEELITPPYDVADRIAAVLITATAKR